MSPLPRISALCLSLAYLAVIAIPCEMPESIVKAAKACPGDTTPEPARPDPEAASAHAGHAHHGAPQTSRAEHAGHSGHPQPAAGDAPALHEPIAKAEPPAQLSAPCLCGCSDSANSAGSSSARIGYALARAGWARACELDPVLSAATLLQPPPLPQLASDPVPG